MSNGKGTKGPAKIYKTLQGKIMIGNKPTNTRTGKQFLLYQLHHVTPIKKHLTASLKS
jgi:hypothetical protein